MSRQERLQKQDNLRSFKMTDVTAARATVAELVEVLNVKDMDEWYEVNRRIMDDDADVRQDPAFKAISALGMNKVSALETIAKFAERLAQDPNDAFSWGEAAVTASGTVALAQEIGWWLDSDKYSWDKMVAQLVKEIIRQRGYGVEGSTSALSNLAAEYKHSAKAKWVETILEAAERE